jgi:hypothetical protein
MLVCKERKKIKIQNLQEIDIQYFKSIKSIGKEIWNEAAPANDLFLQYNYLHFLECFPPDSGSFAYVIFTQNGKNIGIAYFQIGYFDAEKSIHSDSPFVKIITRQINFKALILGNALLTGEHAYHFADFLDKKTQEDLLGNAIEKVENQCIKERRKTSFHLIKDFFQPKNFLIEKNYAPFPFSPNMILDIRPEWNTFESYLDAMSTKYRTRAKRAEKKFVGLKYLEMDVEMIENQQDTIYNLYNKIANGADFNYTFIHKNYFLELKKALGDTYRIVGCYDQNELVGFFTTIYNFDELETGFIGFDEKYNASHQIYLNFLYEMVKIGIENGIKKVVFSRTALEIKSSIGAEPHLMQTYLKAQSPILNRFMPRVVTAISPKQDWQQRKPFKS